MVIASPNPKPMTEGWEGDNPFFLTIVVAPSEESPPSFNTIDLDHPGWIAANADIMRSPGYWALFNKQDVTRPLFVIWVTDGDQPYYSKRHVGVTGGAGGNEIAAYGIGKKCADGSMVRLWAMPDGTVCGGDDVDVIGIRMVHALGPAPR